MSEIIGFCIRGLVCADGHVTPAATIGQVYNNAKMAQNDTLVLLAETVIAEVNDRNLRSKNAILYGIPESSDVVIKSKIQHKGIIDDVQLSDLHTTKIVQSGKGEPGKPRPMKVSFRETSEAITFFKNFDSPNLSNLFPDSTVEMYRDRTLKERSHLQERIKYQNGVPMIVKKTKN
ncbi:pre-mRNA-splicing factor cwc22 [Homalodisca vitripennis]|nr:pre-mRNA-splicing factor cwc22 [Homalodisca vitripennis]